jgi:acetolactate synthase-1/2/3 large subunit
MTGSRVVCAEYGSPVRTGAQILVDGLAAQGTDLAFGVPGESYLAVLDALLDSPLRYVTCRHEAGAANMAEAHGKLTGRPGVCMVTRGPGATHASVGVHTAFQDSTPMLLVVGQVARAMRGREAFQEVDYETMFAPLAKWACEIREAKRIPEVLARAYAVALSGRPGPVVLALPEDVLVEEADVEDVPRTEGVQAHPAAGDVARARELLATAERPVVLVGGQPWNARAAADLQAFCEASQLPVAASFRCQDYVDNASPSYVGHVGIGPDPRLAARVRDADVLLVVGARLGEMTTSGYTLVVPPLPRQTLVHVHADADEVGRVYRPTLGIVSGPAEFAAALRTVEPLDGSRWAAWTRAARTDYEDNLRHTPMAGPVDLGEAMAVLRRRLPDDAILTNGAGNFTVWAHRFYEFRRFRTCLAPTSGSMGYGVPAAIAAKLLHPDRPVVCIAGDGDFLMSANELATAVQYGLPIVVLVVDNGMYGTIRMRQERDYPGRVSGTTLVNPDFVAFARSFGAHAEAVPSTADFEPALERALAAGVPAVLSIPVDPDAITPRTTLSELRAAASRR